MLRVDGGVLRRGRILMKWEEAKNFEVRMSDIRQKKMQKVS
jgi:hypothetical protein